MLPDIGAAFTAFYLADDEVADVIAGEVHIDRIDEVRSWPLLLLSRLPQDSVTTARVDRTVSGTWQIEAFGSHADDTVGAYGLCALAHARARTALPGWVHPDVPVLVTGVRPVSGPQSLPNDEHDKARCAATIRVTAIPRDISVDA